MEFQCVEDFVTHFSNARAAAMAMNLAYDGICVAQYIHEYTSAGCSASGFNTRPLCPHCYIYSGSAAPEDSCTPIDPMFNHQLMSTCHDADLECYLGTCRPPGANLGEMCAGTLRCNEGLACTLEGTVCIEAMPGDPCLTNGESGVLCSSGLWCDGGTCKEPKPIDASCNSNDECLTTRCQNGSCADYAVVCDHIDPMRWPFYWESKPDNG